MNTIKLSYSTINMLYKSSHNWVNKMCGIDIPQREEWENGHRLHRIIQDHLSGKIPDVRLKHLNLTFPIVEEKDFDERCKIFFKINDKYAIRGFLDGLNPENKCFLEIKTGNPMWSINKFAQSMQRKIYALGKPDFIESYLITAFNDETQWNVFRPKVYKMTLTQKDREEAMEWILGGIEIIEKGDFKGGLDENGKCVDKWCYYGENCQFK